MSRLPMLAAALVVLWVSSASALELVMVRSGGCPWCAAWDREVGPVYPKTALGQQLPIRSVYLERGFDLKAKLKSPVRFTPTFVLIDEDREIGRIEGYPGQEFFWGLLENLARGPLDRAAVKAGG